MNDLVKLNVTNSVVSDESGLIYVQSRFCDGVQVFDSQGEWVKSLDLQTLYGWCMKVYKNQLFYGTTEGDIGVFDLGSLQPVRLIKSSWKLWDAGHNYDGRYTAPTGFALHADELFVVDTFDCSILCLSITGQVLYKKSIKDIVGEEYCPSRIDVNDHNILIAFAKNNAVALFNREFQDVHVSQQKGSGEGEFEIPWDVCLTDDTIYVSDLYNHRVQEFDKEFQFLHSYGSWGSKLGEFDYVYSFEIREQRALFSDTWNHGFQIWKKQRDEYKPEIKVSLPDVNSVLRPCRVKVIDGSIVVTDYLNHCFKIFDPELKECQQVIGKLGFDLGEFRYPTGINRGSNCWYATDIRSGRVTAISADLEYTEFLAGHEGAPMSPDSAGFLNSFDGSKEMAAIVCLATDIAVDENQNLYVADIGHQAILKYDSQGNFIDTLGRGILAVDNKTSFIGCEIDAERLYVTNPAKSCINVFDLNGECLDCIKPVVDAVPLKCPTGISINQKYIAIADRLNHRIVLINRENQDAFAIGKLGNQSQEFCAPWDVALLEESVIVVDSLNNRLQKIDL